MAKKIIITCDRCGVELHEGNAQMWDLYSYGSEVCDDCFLLGEMAAEYTRSDILRNQPIGTTAKKVLDLYQDD